MLQVDSMITLFLYGIGAVVLPPNDVTPVNYIIPIWNWSSLAGNFLPFVFSYYIIPIWNWSCVPAVSILPGIANITLFLYGIGAIK